MTCFVTLFLTYITIQSQFPPEEKKPDLCSCYNTREKQTNDLTSGIQDRNMSQKQMANLRNTLLISVFWGFVKKKCILFLEYNINVDLLKKHGDFPSWVQHYGRKFQGVRMSGNFHILCRYRGGGRGVSLY